VAGRRWMGGTTRRSGEGGGVAEWCDKAAQRRRGTGGGRRRRAGGTTWRPGDEWTTLGDGRSRPSVALRGGGRRAVATWRAMAVWWWRRGGDVGKGSAMECENRSNPARRGKDWVLGTNRYIHQFAPVYSSVDRRIYRVIFLGANYLPRFMN
jgi:hypothetical protein